MNLLGQLSFLPIFILSIISVQLSCQQGRLPPEKQRLQPYLFYESHEIQHGSRSRDTTYDRVR